MNFKMKKKSITALAIVISLLILLVIGLIVFKEKINLDIFSNILSGSYKAQQKLSSEEVMEIVKSDVNYSDIEKFLENFEPEIFVYNKLGESEYQKIKPEWKKQGFGDRVDLIDKIDLTDSTYWIELKNKKEETKGLRVVLDIKEKKSLLIIPTLSVKAGMSL